jgi:hypothetical protein
MIFRGKGACERGRGRDNAGRDDEKGRARTHFCVALCETGVVRLTVRIHLAEEEGGVGVVCNWDSCDEERKSGNGEEAVEIHCDDDR